MLLLLLINFFRGETNLDWHTTNDTQRCFASVKGQLCNKSWHNKNWEIKKNTIRFCFGVIRCWLVVHRLSLHLELLCFARIFSALSLHSQFALTLSIWSSFFCLLQRTQYIHKIEVEQIIKILVWKLLFFHIRNGKNCKLSCFHPLYL